jgi:ferrochelatase
VTVSEPRTSIGGYDAILLYSFGGPEGPDEVMPFLENVVRGRPVPKERLEEVAVHYHHFGGKSPIVERTEELLAALKAELTANGIDLPVYQANRFWHPLIEDVGAQMAADGVRRALTFVTSALSSWSGCRAYREQAYRAMDAIGEGAPEIHKIRAFYDHPGYVETWQERIEEALATFGEDRGRTRILFTAHSIPLGMARRCDYEDQLKDLARLLTARVGHEHTRIVYQSRSGPPRMPWLEPDILDALDTLHAEDPSAPVLVAPIGFVADHMEVVWDLDHEAREKAAELGLPFARATCPNAHPRYVTMIRELIEERLYPEERERKALGTLGVRPDLCPPDCCLPGERPKRPARPS